MPNWVSNSVDVIADEDWELEEFLRFNTDKDGNIDFHKGCPEPFKQNGDIKDDWYNWRLANWGCKWNGSEFHSGGITEVRTQKRIPTIYYHYPLIHLGVAHRSISHICLMNIPCLCLM